MTWSESFKMAAAAIGAHKLRSFLTLVGIIAGVAAIISVMTGVSVVQSQMEAELSVLSTRTFQIQKWPRGFSTEEERLRYLATYLEQLIPEVREARERSRKVQSNGHFKDHDEG